jgi:hypothetical protein
MNNPNYISYCRFDYTSNISKKDKYKLGDIVFHIKQQEVGIIIQIQDTDNFRTDMFGNTHCSEIRLATQNDIDMFRPEVSETSIDKNFNKKFN